MSICLTTHLLALVEHLRYAKPEITNRSRCPSLWLRRPFSSQSDATAGSAPEHCKFLLAVSKDNFVALCSGSLFKSAPSTNVKSNAQRKCKETLHPRSLLPSEDYLCPRTQHRYRARNRTLGIGIVEAKPRAALTCSAHLLNNQ